MEKNLYKTKNENGVFSVELNGCKVKYYHDEEIVAEYILETEEQAVKKFNQLKNLMIKIK